jgi:hypothetical protein
MKELSATGGDRVFENRQDSHFIDNSRVSLVGKVVGGSIEAAKTVVLGRKN